jgi:polyphosphate kinase 2 (PPK2 family)
MSEVIESIESENEKDIVLVDVVKKLQKKNTPLTALPDNKKSTHVLVAKRKEEISYEEAMLPLQLELVKLQRYIQESGKRVLVIFEGRDAAGK